MMRGAQKFDILKIQIHVCRLLNMKLITHPSFKKSAGKLQICATIQLLPTCLWPVYLIITNLLVSTRSFFIHLYF
jgi:hypothetical protein